MVGREREIRMQKCGLRRATVGRGCRAGRRRHIITEAPSMPLSLYGNRVGGVHGEGDKSVDTL